MDYGEAFPDLDQFIGCYFHQNWIDLAKARGDVVHPGDSLAFAGANATYLLAIKRDIRGLLARKYSEEQLRHLILKEFMEISIRR